MKLGRGNDWPRNTAYNHEHGARAVSKSLITELLRRGSGAAAPALEKMLPIVYKRSQRREVGGIFVWPDLKSVFPRLSHGQPPC
jgi:hypothetical protein